MIAMIHRTFFAFLPIVLMFFYFGAIIAVIIYIIWLLHRLVKAVEKIAEKIG